MKNRNNSFRKMVPRLTHNNGWIEDCPSRDHWYFRKNKWLATVNWVTLSITFERA